MFIDYGGLISAIKQEYYPLPNVSILLQGFKARDQALFTEMIWIDMDEEAIPLRRFSTYQGRLRQDAIWLVNAPSIFQRFMNVVLVGLTGLLYMVYLDYIITYNADSPEDDVNRVRQLFNRLRKANTNTETEEMQFFEENPEVFRPHPNSKGFSP